ncbi:MAG TPA: WYL domain-containing protein, partial [Microlunatus sp.]
AIEFVTGAAEDEDLGGASMVRLQAPEPGRELGVAYLSVSELARLYRAGRDRLELEPENETLRSAVNKLRAGLLPGVTPSVRGPLEPPPSDFEVARRQRRRVAVVYAGVWHPGDRERVIEPYRLIHTRRGWEIDAGPVHADGELHTLLLDRIQSYTVLDQTFELPADLYQLLARQRTLFPVELIVPHETRWSVEKYAERVEVLAEDETSARLRALLFQPVRHRIGLILADGGQAARVIKPPDLADAGEEVASALLTRYQEGSS